MAEFECRGAVDRRFREQQRACRTDFRTCAEPQSKYCRPSQHAGEAATCRTEIRAGYERAVATCDRTYGVTSRACANRNLACAQQCADVRRMCDDQAHATLDATMAGCFEQYRLRSNACQLMNPSGGPGVAACLYLARVPAITCRDGVLTAADRASAACRVPYIQCVRACP